ncbi:hypothetical protein [Nostoc favosum]|uniref:Histidine kinase n=1 Tax=Nostoc favosum CHAB5714 TaxID=2780399 RepID=A0ABS8IAA4_9NOSO|nr:hypothetical protein [Nostoc favosum]MCC5601035.1 hypothetical protein [Nostoc favosum CHAB5714]
MGDGIVLVPITVHIYERDEGDEGGGGDEGEELLIIYQCPMPNAQCPMPNAPCPISTDLSQLLLIQVVIMTFFSD